MPTYTFRCESHGDFTVEQPMSTTTPQHPCLDCAQPSFKVLTLTVHYPYGGRSAFHDGPEGDGHTVRETVQHWKDDWDSAGVKYEPSGTRWI